MTFPHITVATAKSVIAYSDKGTDCRLVEFFAEIKKTIPLAHLVPFTSRSGYLYVEGELYVRGTLEVSSKVRDGTLVNTYIIRSRQIHRVRSRDHEMQHAKESINLKTAVKSAKQFMTAYSVGDKARVHRNQIKTKMAEVEREVSYEKRNVARDLGLNIMITADTPVIQELRRLVDMGHEFVDPSMTGRLNSYFKKLDEHKTLLLETPSVTYVYLGDYCYETASMSDKATFLYPNSAYYSAEKLPEPIKGRLAVLSILEDGNFVHGVGGRINDKEYYVVE